MTVKAIVTSSASATSEWVALLPCPDVVTFHSAIILPEGKSPTDRLETHEYWVGKIKDVRCLADNPLEVSGAACHVRSRKILL